MADFTVVGSGASGVHFAFSALDHGRSVEMVDVGWTPEASVNPKDSFADLKQALADPAAYFLGRNFEGVLLPGTAGEFYGIPPSKEYALRPVHQFGIEGENFAPLSSFAQGGLAEAWTGGCYPFNEHELEDFPFSYNEIEPFYARVAGRIGISGENDDLAPSVPFHPGLQEPLKLDQHSALLLSLYRGKKRTFQSKLGCRIGRARQAVLSRDSGDRQSCDYLGRCLWGCPRNALYTPAVTLKECLKHPQFTYTNGHYVRYFRYNDSRRIETIVLQAVDGQNSREIPVNTLVLAAGTLGSSRILLESVFRESGEVIRLHGLMDNRQILVPFLNLFMLGKSFEAQSYQYNQLAMGFDAEHPKHYIHCLITALKTSMIHPIVDKFPFDLKTSLHLFRNLHASLGLVNVNFHDTRRRQNYLTLDITNNPEHPILKVHYCAPENERQRLDSALKRVKQALFRLGCIVPPGMAHLRPMGASVHYAGTLPMTNDRAGKWSTGPDCRSNDFKNLFVVDGSTYPFLPAKNTTFTLMANAMRVADILST
ncbi:MAG: GMC family oxidoreductase [Methylococcaceae bacterium]|nr:GMC family oxidoreductase [Methylococcaceae bacterium]MCI0732986.1 GMC family oxidoreductase [Methylococcaceae bacterium]